MHAFTSRRLTAMLLLAVAVTIVASIVNARLVEGQAQPQVTNTTALLTTNRTGLKVCVASLVPGIESRTVQEQIRGILTKISNHPDFQPAGLGRQPVVVDGICPSAPTITNPNYNSTDMLGAPAQVTTPSQYRTFVFVASAEQLAPAFVGRVSRTTAQELLCEQPQQRGCTVVTVAVYVTPQELADQAFLERSLTHAIGLWPVGEPRFNPAPVPPRERGPARP